MHNLPKRTASSDDQFQAAFDDVPYTTVNSLKDLICECQKHTAILENADIDWNKRNHSLQLLRSLVNHDIEDFHSLAEQSHYIFTQSLVTSIKDLRSQVCREACITIAFFSLKFGVEFYRTAEAVLQITFNLSQNSAKVMASSAYNANLYIAKYIHHPKILALALQQLKHKAKEVRRMMVTFVTSVINSWSSQMLEKHWKEIIHCVKVSLSDADCDVRATARIAYEHLQTLYPQEAENLFQQLEPAKQKILAGHASAASSTHSINSERCNLPNSNKGLYNKQSNFFSDRSKSDMNYAFRKLNIGTKTYANKQNFTLSKPPQVTTFTQKTNVIAPAPNISARRHHVPASNKPNAVQTSLMSANLKSNTQRSRSNSPSQHKLLPNSSEKKVTNSPISTPVRGGVNLSIKDTKVRIRPNVVRTTNKQMNGLSIELTPGGDDINGFYGSPINQNVLHEPRQSNGRHLASSSQNDNKFINSDSFHNSNKKNSSLPARTSNKWICKVTDNSLFDQNHFIFEVSDLLLKANTDINIDEKEFEQALDSLTQALKDKRITSWDENFQKILLSITHVMVNSPSILAKAAALRSLKELCHSQPEKLAPKAELILVKVFNAHEEDATVSRAAEDCGFALIDCLPPNQSLQLINTVIDDENSKHHQLCVALKILGHSISKMNPSDVRKLLPQLLTRMTKCYENSQSMIRRAAVICLVQLSNLVGMSELEPHLSQSTVKLVEVYRDKMTTKN